jgi:hypothetical protein
MRKYWDVSFLLNVFVRVFKVVNCAHVKISDLIKDLDLLALLTDFDVFCYLLIFFFHFLCQSLSKDFLY